MDAFASWIIQLCFCSLCTFSEIRNMPLTCFLIVPQQQTWFVTAGVEKKNKKSYLSFSACLSKLWVAGEGLHCLLAEWGGWKHIHHDGDSEMDCLCINEVKGWDIAARSNYAMQLNRLAFQYVQDVRNHQEEIQCNKSLMLELLTSIYCSVLTGLIYWESSSKIHKSNWYKPCIWPLLCLTVGCLGNALR